jgi:diketogulonate reductase-like aldo/keto reductase
MTLIDTAEMYAKGAAEELVGEAIAGRRQEIFLVTKVLPKHATRRGMIRACEGSLRRLQTDRIDLYLLHWREDTPLLESVDALVRLQQAGKVRSWRVSNFDIADMMELFKLPGDSAAATHQVLYNLSRRGVEYDLLPWCNEHNLWIMAYSPIEQGRILGAPVLKSVAARHNAIAAQIGLAWLLCREGVVAIPKAGSPQHVRENRDALDIRLTSDDLAELDGAFPPPLEKFPLEML